MSEVTGSRESSPVGARGTRGVSGFNIFSPVRGGAAFELPDTLSVETVLEKGLNELELSPVHLAFRGAAAAGSVRCEWRGIARTPEQRERAIRFWLELDDDDDPLPSPTEVETTFLRILNAIVPAFPETVEANFRDLARGGLSTDYVFLSCFADFSVAEYILGAGPSSLTVAYDNLAEARSYGLYQRAYDSGELVTSSTLPLSEAEYQSELEEIVWNVESSLSEILEGRESVLFLAPMGAHNAIAVEAWQTVAQWDLQTDEDDVVRAVRYGVPEGDPERTQTLANLKSRVTTAATTDDFADDRIANASGLTQYYRDIGAYGDITPDDGETTTFTPAQPPPVHVCANGAAVADPGANRPLVHDCQALLDSMDTLRGTAALNWSVDTPITDWDGVTAGGAPSRVTKVELPSKSLTGIIPGDLGNLFQLTHLDLSRNQLTGEIPPVLGELTDLEVLHLAGNSLTGCVPAALRDVHDNDHATLGLPYCGDLPPAPQGLTAREPGRESVGLGWNEVDGANLYRVEYRAAGSGGEWTTDAQDIVAPEHTVEGLACETTHELRVSAHGDGVAYVAGWGPWSTAASETTGPCNLPPAFASSSYSFSISDGAENGDVVGMVSATDPDTGDAVSYSITGGNGEGKLTIDGSTGEITVAGALDYAAIPSYTLTVEARDGNGGAATAAVAVSLTLAECSNGAAVTRPEENPGLVRDCSVLLTAREALAGGGAALDWRADTSITRWQGVIVGRDPSPHLRHLLLADIGLTGSIPAALGGLEDLRRLDLDGNDLTGGIPGELAGLADLEYLYLYDNRLTGGIPSELGELTNLKVLFLSGNMLTGEIPPELAGLSNLGQLVLDGNMLTGGLPPRLGGMASLEELWVRDNLLTGEIPPELEDLARLGHLYLEGNGFTGCIPPGLRDVENNDLDLLGLAYCSSAAP